MGRLSDSRHEGVVSGFVAHLGRALRCWRADPRLPLTVAVIAACTLLPTAIGRAIGAEWLSAASFVVTLVTLGFLGATRVWYVEVDAGLKPPRSELLGLCRSRWKRFFGLGVYTSVVFLVPLLLAAALLAANEFAGAAALFLVSVAIDILLTFATVALSFFDMTAGDAVRYSWAITRAQWPQCALYVLAAPMAVRLTFAVVPASEMPVVVYVVVSFLLVGTELACKGATVLFYADRYFTTPPAAGPPASEVTPG